MKLSAIESLKALTTQKKQDAQLVIVPVWEDKELAHFAGHFENQSENFHEALADFDPKPGAVQLIYGNHFRVLLIGLGKTSSAIFPVILKTFRQVAAQQKALLKPQAAIMLSHLTDKELHANAVVNGLVCGSYLIGTWKKDAEDNTHPLDQENSELLLITGESEEKSVQILETATRAYRIALAQKQAMHLVNAPSNIKTPPFLSETARSWGENYGQKVTILSGKEIEETGLHALAAVNRGSEYEAQFIVMEYEPESTTDATKTIGLVGKGITFDTGGLSIKTSAGMYFMKSDMGGAAAVFGLMEAAASLSLPHRLIAVIPVTDNLIDARSFKPSDIISSYSGKTIEIMDTDAEGRLILADGLSWITDHHKLDYLFDFATLTGATVRAIGYAAAGMFTNCDDTANLVYEAGLQTGEKVWRFPLWSDYDADLHSDVADLRNLSGKPIAGGISAAKFLEQFVREHPKWVHLDIAGVAFGDNELGKHKNGTGYGVRLMIEFLERLENLK
ncbi:MAG: leucyl aminopeptidase family protein [Balneolales bacterium]|nr:leucyl aminopeptidase family protein [Balneolales bacterium]